MDYLGQGGDVIYDVTGNSNKSCAGSLQADCWVLGYSTESGATANGLPVQDLVLLPVTS